MLNYEKPDDFVLATNESHTVRDFVKEAFKVIGIEIEFKGRGLNEVGIDSDTKKILVKVNPEHFRPLESDNYKGDYSKAKNLLKWEPRVKFKELVKIMVNHDLKVLSMTEVVGS